VILGVIPARGGSKAIPDKNIRDFCGKPLLGWAVEKAKRSAIDRVVVSTDSPEIGEVGFRHGAEVVIRPPEISGDKDASEWAVKHAMDRFPGFSAVVMMQCTSPLTRVADIDACIDALREFDCCFTVHETTALLWDEKGGINHDWRSRPMRQDRVQYEENGAVYAMRAAGFEAAQYRFFGEMAYHITPRNIDIDTWDDFVMAEALMVESGNVAA